MPAGALLGETTNSPTGKRDGDSQEYGETTLFAHVADGEMELRLGEEGVHQHGLGGRT